MFKPVTTKQNNKMSQNYKKFISTLFGVEAIGATKQEAEQNLYDLINWNTKQFRKYFQHENIIAILSNSPYDLNQYHYSYIREGRESGTTIFDAISDKEAINKAQRYFDEYIGCSN